MASLLKRIQRDAYLVSRAAGDMDAARRGPAPLTKRLVRRWITAKAFSAARRSL
jgi:hypothetical protein